MSLLSRLRVPSKFLLLDAARFVAATLVVFHHWKTNLILAPQHQVWLKRLDIFQLSVDLFFMISGFIICHVYKDRIRTGKEYWDYLSKRFARLYPLHFITLLFITFLAYISHDILVRPQVYEKAAFARNLLLVNAWFPHQSLSFNIVAWSISVEVFCYLIFPLGLLLYRRSPLILLPWLVPIAILGFLRPHVSESLSHWRLFLAIPEFFFGVGVCGIQERLPRIRWAGWIISGLFLLSTLLALKGVTMTHLSLVPAGIFLICVGSKQSNPVSWLLVRLAALGQLTYSIYMWHIPLQFAFRILPALTSSPIAHNGAVVVAYFFLLAFSYISFIYIESPARKWLTPASAQRARLSGRERSEEQVAP
jgi:peptidoglycan/LPS O-acetylase OafA/YrhL